MKRTKEELKQRRDERRAYDRYVIENNAIRDISVPADERRAHCRRVLADYDTTPIKERKAKFEHYRQPWIEFGVCGF